MNMFVNRLNGEPIGVTVLGIFVIDKNTILAVSRMYNTARAGSSMRLVKLQPQGPGPYKGPNPRYIENFPPLLAPTFLQRKIAVF